MRYALLLCVLVVSGVPRTAGAQLPAGYTRAEWGVTLPDTLFEVVHGGRFRITVTRAASDQRERELLRVAETLIPPADSIEASTAEYTGAGWIQGFAAARERPGPRWWWLEWDGVWLPYALTAEAVSEYILHVRALSTSPNPFARYNPGVQLSVSLEYTAAVHPMEEASGHRVELTVKYYMYCGPLCALSFRQARIVMFDPDGNVLRIEGDSRPAVLVS